MTIGFSLLVGAKVEVISVNKSGIYPDFEVKQCF
jgi:hypothetical protein